VITGTAARAGARVPALKVVGTDTTNRTFADLAVRVLHRAKPLRINALQHFFIQFRNVANAPALFPYRETRQIGLPRQDLIWHTL